MERKIVLSLFYMGVVTAVVGVIITTLTYYAFFRREIRENLAHECHLVADCYDSGDPITELDKFTGEELRITLIKKDGTVLFESKADSQGMPNHLDRPEIKSAIENGSGTDTRFSDTIGTEDYYYALRLDDGNILRVSIKADSIFALWKSTLEVVLASTKKENRASTRGVAMRRSCSFVICFIIHPPDCEGAAHCI